MMPRWITTLIVIVFVAAIVVPLITTAIAMLLNG